MVVLREEGVIPVCYKWYAELYIGFCIRVPTFIRCCLIKVLILTFWTHLILPYFQPWLVVKLLKKKIDIKSQNNDKVNVKGHAHIILRKKCLTKYSQIKQLGLYFEMCKVNVSETGKIAKLGLRQSTFYEIQTVTLNQFFILPASKKNFQNHTILDTLYITQAYFVLISFHRLHKCTCNSS